MTHFGTQPIKYGAAQRRLIQRRICDAFKLMDAGYVILGAGVRTAKIKVSPAIFHALPNVDVVEGLALPRQ